MGWFALEFVMMEIIHLIIVQSVTRMEEAPRKLREPKIW